MPAFEILFHGTGLKLIDAGGNGPSPAPSEDFKTRSGVWVWRVAAADDMSMAVEAARAVLLEELVHSGELASDSPVGIVLEVETIREVPADTVGRQTEFIFYVEPDEDS